MNIKNEICAIKELLNLSQNELANELGVSFESINRWESEKTDVEKANVETVYSYAFKKGIFLNSIYEQLYTEKYQKDNIKVLFHGCKNNLYLPVDLNHSKKFNDFGIGFYLGENFKQAATYIANSLSSNVLIFDIDLDDLNKITFGVNYEWMIAIAYYRGWLEKYKDHRIVKEIVNKIESNDVIIAPIADNRMFDIISEFIRGEITDLQCQHALSATNLGMQYVLRSCKAIEKLNYLKECYVSQIEKENYIMERFELNQICQDKVKIARIEFRGKGKYIDELLK